MNRISALFGIILSLMAPSAWAVRPIGTTGSVDSLTVGGRTIVDKMSILKVLYDRPGGSFPYGNFRESGGTSDYQVPTGKTFRVVAAHVETIAATGALVGLAYSDVAIGQGSNSAPTNAVYVGGAVAQGPFSIQAVGTKYYALNFVVPVGKYITLNNQSAADNLAVTLYGYEE